MSRSHKNWFSNSVAPFILLQRERQGKSSFTFSVRFEPRGDAVRRARRSRRVVEKLRRHGASLGARAMRRGVHSRGVLVLVFVDVIMTCGPGGAPGRRVSLVICLPCHNLLQSAFLGHPRFMAASICVRLPCASHNNSRRHADDMH